MKGFPQIPGGWTQRAVKVGSRNFVLTLPESPDAFLDDPQVHRANRESDYMPYWSYLWPASVLMAGLVLESRLTAEAGPGARTLEIGAGIGLVGIAGLAAGLQVTFSDYDQTAVCLARNNAVQNRFPEPSAVKFDWKDVEETGLDPFPVILGCDVIYETKTHSQVLNVLDRLLVRDGVCWLGDPGRSRLPEFAQLAESRGYRVEVCDQKGAEVPRGTSCREKLLSDSRFVLNSFRLLRLRRLSPAVLSGGN